MHATIERKRKHMKLYTTREWALLISAARIKPSPYQVTVMHYDDFYDLKELTRKIVKNVTETVDGEKVNWMKMKWIRLQKSKPTIIQYRNDLLEGTFFEIDINQRKRTGLQEKNELNWSDISLKPMYSHKLPVSEQKKKDLLSLLKSKVIPEEYRYFIEGIPTTNRFAEVSEEEQELENQ